MFLQISTETDLYGTDKTYHFCKNEKWVELTSINNNTQCKKTISLRVEYQILFNWRKQAPVLNLCLA